MYAINGLKAIKYTGFVATTALYKDEMQELKDLNIHSVYNIYSETGFGFADHLRDEIGELNPKDTTR